MNSSLPTRQLYQQSVRKALHVVLPVPYVLLALAASEVGRLPRLSEFSASAVVGMCGLSLGDQARAFSAFAGPLGLLAVSVSGATLAPRLVKPLIATAVAAAVVNVAHTYEVLVQYPRFRGYVPLLVLWGLLGVYVACSYALLVGRSRPSLVEMQWAAAGGGAAIVLPVASSILYRDAYPTLHAAVFGTTFLLAHAALAQLWSRSSSLPKLLVAACAPWIVVVACGSFSVPVVAASHYYAGTILGRMRPFDPTEEVSCNGIPAASAPRAQAVWQSRVGLPTLPASFHLEDYNVLFVLVETLRFSDTSLSGEANASTPALTRLVDEGAYYFKRAYAPSSVTLASVASVLSMTYPSHAELTVRTPHWTGALRSGARTVAHHFASAGYATFRVVHGIRQELIAGLGQGFQDAHVERSIPHDIRGDWIADESIAEQAVARIREFANRRFFGFVFFGGPHAPYASPHEANSENERYRQEIAHTDQQLARVLRALQEAHIAEHTLVIVAGDHGEEFGEHGGEWHGRTLYDESIHVPLLVYLPGVRGAGVEDATSLVYVFPWLLRAGSEPLRSAADAVIQHDLAPMLMATEGAVVAELLGAQRMQAALIYAGTKVIYDFSSRKQEVYNLRMDPTEQVDLSLSDPAESSHWSARVHAYRQVRACNQRFRVE